MAASETYKEMQRFWPDRPTETVAVINQKGGVGKSTSAVNLAAALGARKVKVLVIDFDPQGNTTSGLGVDKDNLDADIYDSLMREVPIESLIHETCAEGVFLVPASIQLAGAEIELVSMMGRESFLAEELKSLEGQFDYIFIDCPPSLGLLTLNALGASSGLLIPIQCEYYALEGVTKLMETMELVQGRLNPALHIYGVLMTMYDKRTTLSKQVVEEVRKYFGDLVFKTMIPRSVKVSEAPSFGLPVTMYAPRNKGAMAYNRLAKEVINRG